MPHPLASLIGAFAASAALACAGAASAEMAPGALGAGYTSADAPLGASTELEIHVRGRVSARCEVATSPTGLDRVDMGGRGQTRGVFGIDCNTPFIFRVRSEHGGFAGDAGLSGVQPLAPYQMQVELGTDQGRQNLGWCNAAALSESPTGACAFASSATEGGWSSRDAVAINETGAVTLRWDAPPEGEARAGAYRDTIIIELEVRS